MDTFPSSAPREARAAARLRYPAWINWRTVLGVVIFAGSLLGSRVLMVDRQTTIGLWVAAHDLPAHEPLGASDFELIQVRLPGESSSRYVGGATAPAGIVLSEPVPAGELIPISATGSLIGDGRAITIPVTPEHAVGGALARGDRVDVFATFLAGRPDARTKLLVANVELLDLVTTEGLVLEDGAPTGITLEVTPEQAQRLAYAIRSAEIDVVKVLSGSVADG